MARRGLTGTNQMRINIMALAARLPEGERHLFPAPIPRQGP
jgi:hypothetical protein